MEYWNCDCRADKPRPYERFWVFCVCYQATQRDTFFSIKRLTLQDLHCIWSTLTVLMKLLQMSLLSDDAITTMLKVLWLGTEKGGWFCTSWGVHQQPPGGTRERYRYQWTHEGTVLLSPPSRTRHAILFPHWTHRIYGAPLGSHGRKKIDFVNFALGFTIRGRRFCPLLIKQHINNDIEMRNISIT